jgi:hypothetical protein
MKKTGIIKAISPKAEGRNAFTLKNEQIDGKDVWFWGYLLEAKKGDEVEFEMTENEGFHNFSKLRVLKMAEDKGGKENITSSPTPPSPPSTNEETAIRLTVALAQQRYENILTPEGIVLAYTEILNRLNKTNGQTSH